MNRYFGMDTHKKFVMVAAVNAEQQVTIEPYRVEMADLVSWTERNLTSQDSIVIEVTANTWHIYDILTAQAGEVVVANPFKTRIIAEARIKSDKIDAVILARLLASRFICDVWVPSTSVRQHRVLVAHRAILSKQISQVKNRIHALLTRHDYSCPEKSVFSTKGQAWLDSLPMTLIEQLERAHLLAQLDLIKTQRIQAERQIAQLAAQDDRVPRLMQITGIGYFAAFAILAAIGNIQRFPSAKRLASYAGLVPSLHQSGDHSYSGHITRAGSPNLRWLLVEAAWSAVRFDPHWQQVYEGIQRRRGSSIAIVAIARKILVVVWYLLSNHSTYYYLQPQIFVRKLQEWAWRIGRKELPSTSSIAFVQDRLNSVGLSDLAKGLTTNRKGKLQFERQISTQLENDATLPSYQSALLAV